MALIRNKFKKGSLSVELLIATAIIAIALISVILASASSVRASRQTLRQTQAVYLLEEGAEALSVIRASNWSNISNLTNDTNYYLSFSGSAWSIGTTPTTDGFFTRIIRLSSVERDANDDIVQSGGTIDSGTRKIKIEISWSEGVNIKTKTLEFYMTNFI